MSGDDTKNAHVAGKKRRHHLPGGKSALLILLFWFAVGWGGLITWQTLEHTAAIGARRKSLARMGKASIEVLEAAIRSMGRGRRERPEFLSFVLREVVNVPEIKGGWVTDIDGTLLAATGLAEGLPTPGLESEETWLEDGLIVGDRIDIGPCLIGSGRRSSTFSPQSRPLRLLLYVDRSHIDQEIADDLELRLGIVVAAGVALAGAFLFLRGRVKTIRVQEKLVDTEESAQRNREMALLGAGLAHETKNPIAVVRGLAQGLAGEAAVPSRYRKDAGRIVDEADRVVTRIDEFLQFSRPVEPTLASVDLLPLLNEMAQLIQADLSPRKGRITVEASAVAVDADGDILRQILLNLLVNAAQALPDNGEIHLQASVAADETVTIEVKDNGRGLPVGEIDKVFEPYYTRKQGGTGLGLAVVRRLVEAHGWHVAIASEPGTGTSVRISGIRKLSHEQRR